MNRSANACRHRCGKSLALTVDNRDARLNRCEPLLRHLVAFVLATFEKLGGQRTSVDELLRTSVCNDYLDRNEADRVELLLSAIESPEALHDGQHDYSDEAAGEFEVYSAAAAQFAVSGQTSFGTSSSRWPSRRRVARFSCSPAKQE